MTFQKAVDDSEQLEVTYCDSGETVHEKLNFNSDCMSIALGNARYTFRPRRLHVKLYTAEYYF